MSNFINVLGSTIGYTSDNAMINVKDRALNYRYFQVMASLPTGGKSVISLLFNPNE